MSTSNKTVVTNFINDIWNQNQFEKIDNYVSANFTDHSLPQNLPAGKEGTKLWITNTGKSFQHTTIIDEMISEDDTVMLKIRMQLKHVGPWREIEPTHIEVETVGYRLFKLNNGKIIAHWALIDGNTIENALRNTTSGCKVKQQAN